MWNCTKTFFTRFCTESSVHGVKYLIQDKNKISRCYWCIVIIVALLLSGQFTMLLAHRFLEIPFWMIIKDHQARTEELRLPSITFCTENPTTNEWLDKFLDNVTFPPNISREVALEAIQFTLNKVTPRYEEMPLELINVTLFEILDQLLKFNEIQPREFMERVSVPCDALISRCQLRGWVVPCGAILKRVRGQCCLFDDDQELQQPGTVYGNSLIVVTTVNYGDTYFMAHNVEAEPISTQTIYAMTNGYYVMFYTQVIKVQKSEEVHEVEEDSGDCVHPDEQDLRFYDEYDATRCNTEYAINASLALCGCAGTYLPAPDHFTCNFSQLSCLKMHPEIKVLYASTDEMPNHILVAANRKGIEMQPKCPKACEFLSYKYIFNPRSLVPQYDYSGFFDGVDAANEFVVHFNYDSPYYTVQEFVLVSDWITLISNLGGVYGLFLGCSMMTLVEFVFFLWSAMIKKLLCDDASDRQNKNNNNQNENTQLFLY